MKERGEIMLRNKTDDRLFLIASSTLTVPAKPVCSCARHQDVSWSQSLIRGRTGGGGQEGTKIWGAVPGCSVSGVAPGSRNTMRYLCDVTQLIYKILIMEMRQKGKW